MRSMTYEVGQALPDGIAQSDRCGSPATWTESNWRNAATPISWVMNCRPQPRANGTGECRSRRSSLGSTSESSLLSTRCTGVRNFAIMQLGRSDWWCQVQAGRNVPLSKVSTRRWSPKRGSSIGWPATSL